MCVCVHIFIFLTVCIVHLLSMLIHPSLCTPWSPWRLCTFLPLALDGMRGQLHAPVAFPAVPVELGDGWASKVIRMLCRREDSQAAAGIRTTIPRTPCPWPSYYTDSAVRVDTNVLGKDQLKYAGTRAETRFCLSVKRTSPFKSAGASVQSTTGSPGVRISGINAGYTMFRGSVKGTGYPLHSPVSLSLPLPCVTACHHISIGVYKSLRDVNHTAVLIFYFTEMCVLFVQFVNFKACACLMVFMILYK